MLEDIAAYAPAAPVFSAGAAFVAAIGIWAGLIAMVLSNMGRKGMMKADKRRHIESMKALADQRRESAEAAEAARRESANQRRALEALIARTAATAPHAPPRSPHSRRQNRPVGPAPARRLEAAP